MQNGFSARLKGCRGTSYTIILLNVLLEYIAMIVLIQHLIKFNNLYNLTDHINKK